VKLEKTTKTSSDTKRGYEDACGLAHALELIGERWAPLVLRELALGPRRFSELRADLPGISANILTQRLAELEERGLVRRRKLAPPASVQVYEATQWARDAEPILCALGRWASRSPLHNPSHPVSPVAIMLSMKTNFDSEIAGDLEVTVEFRFGQVRHFARVKDGRLDIPEEAIGQPDLIVDATPNELKPVLYGGAPVDLLKFHGDPNLAGRFFSSFSLPEKAAASPVETGAGMA